MFFCKCQGDAASVYAPVGWHPSKDQPHLALAISVSLILEEMHAGGGHGTPLNEEFDWVKNAVINSFICF